MELAERMYNVIRKEYEGETFSDIIKALELVSFHVNLSQKDSIELAKRDKEKEKEKGNVQPSNF